MKVQNLNNSDEQGSRERLIEAGTMLFAERGYASTSVREIVARAGVTKPVLYYYFKNKEGLFRAILNRAAEQQKALLDHVLETTGTVLDRLIHLYTRVYQGVSENQNLFKMIHNLIFGTPQGAPECDLELYHLRMVDAIKAIYRDGLAVGEINDADLEEVAILVLSLIDFSLHMEHINPDKMDPERPARLLRLAFKGLNQRGEG